MKIAFIGQKGVPATWGGVEQHVHHLVEELATQAPEASLVVYARKHYVSKSVAQQYASELPSVSIVHTPSIPSKHLDAISHTFFSTLHAMWNSVDVYHFHGVGPSLLAWMPRVFRPRARVITTFHSHDRLHSKWGRFARTVLTIGEWAALRFAHRTIAVSKYIQSYSTERYNMTPVYVPNGVSRVDRLRPSRITAEFGLKGNDYVLVVTRLLEHKGVHHLIRAFKKINTTKKLVIVGDSVHTDEYVAFLRRLARGDDRILFTGFQSGAMLQELFSNALLYVQPSESEGLSVSVLEAAAYGLPTIASDIPANAEVVAERGFLFKNANVADLTKQLQSLLRNSKKAQDERAAASRALRRHVRSDYAWEDIARNTIALYEEVHGNRSMATRRDTQLA